MKSLLALAFASLAAVVLSNCGCTTETHNVTVRTYGSQPTKASNPESFEPVERF